ncbi:Nse1 non-SMC component of SMC5-6 complex-domain-containing protein [Aspergillus coremiiformis]|uniref:Non-structural maintenance of chromosomes element 1 homolog n=1 Tax=Aspergillus coremiiformis TaxID=138285 RepID=A0A5N6Z3E5_9EURO|nr:Nse1 non-SMC component of SMC5-6 complex-domain-containing protein [Aspergillus coremiiformis]
MATRHDRVGYNDSNRAFLQAFMARSAMTFEEARPVLAAIFSVQEGEPVSAEDVTEEDLASYIAAANTTISPFDLEIRSTLRQSEINPEDSGNQAPERVYALVNTTSDALTQLATTYSADEISFVKRILDAMFDTNNTRRSEAMVVSSMQAIQLAKASSGDTNRRESTNATQSHGGAAQSLSMSQAETVLKQLVEEGWLEKSRKGFYSLSPRGLMELRGWLVATFNDENEEGRRMEKIKFCAACRDIITRGQRCGNRDCSGRLHEHCMRNFFRMQQAEQCPVCKAPWPGDKFVGERAITSTERHMQDRRRSANTQRRSGVGSSSQIPSEGAADSD